jgi:hypothetical protein
MDSKLGWLRPSQSINLLSILAEVLPNKESADGDKMLGSQVMGSLPIAFG